KRTGINAVKNINKSGVAGFIEKVFKVCFVMIAVIALNYVFIEQNYSLLIPISYLETKMIGYIGIVLSFTGLLFGFIAQLQMGDAWRLGYNEKEQPSLVDKKLFAYSRNPIYLGIVVSNLGFFLMMPNALSLCFLVLSYVAISIKIRLEEGYLIQSIGQDYKDYLKRVRRWI
ncbi:MAG: isoprenylcysteine carboxylmethyltransferase family protein, partial [Bacteroidota bacterium]